jgi:hypothetical protein
VTPLDQSLKIVDFSLQGVNLAFLNLEKFALFSIDPLAELIERLLNLRFVAVLLLVNVAASLLKTLLLS